MIKTHDGERKDHNGNYRYSLTRKTKSLMGKKMKRAKTWNLDGAENICNILIHIHISKLRCNNASLCLNLFIICFSTFCR